MAAGIPDITRHAGCTAAEPGRFFSYRRDGLTGRFASLIWLT
jgi:copper oxidase (laccase) domain-containing protein